MHINNEELERIHEKNYEQKATVSNFIRMEK